MRKECEKGEGEVCISRSDMGMSKECMGMELGNMNIRVNYRDGSGGSGTEAYRSRSYMGEGVADIFVCFWRRGVGEHADLSQIWEKFGVGLGKVG